MNGDETSRQVSENPGVISHVRSTYLLCDSTKVAPARNMANLRHGEQNPTAQTAYKRL
jgi:hypothetical protein